MGQIERFKVEAEQAEARIEALEAALQAVEWFDRGYDVYECPWCGAILPERGEARHYPSCARQAVLAAKAGGEQ
jgi:hypothetical protein